MTGLQTGWRCIRLREAGEWFGGGTPSKSNSSFWSDGSIPWLSPKDMGPETLTDTRDHITASAISGSAAKRVRAGSVAVVMRSGILERRFPVAFVPFETTLNQDMKAIIPLADIDARWIAWGLRAFEREILRKCRKAGTTVASIEASRLMDFALPIPPLEEQRRIVDILEDQISGLDAAEAGLDSASRRASRLTLTSGMQAITGVGSKNASRSVSFGDREVALPRGWQASTVGDEASLVQYGTSSKTSEVTNLDAIAVLRMGNLQRGAIVTDKLKYLPRDHPDVASLLLQRGDLLFNRTNSAELVGKSAVFDRDDNSMTFASYLIRVRFGPAVRPAWANLVINSPLGRAYVRSVASQQVGQANVNGTKLKAFPLVIPPLDVQDRLLARHEAVDETRRRLVAEVARTRQRTLLLRRALLRAAFTGRLTATSSDLVRAEESIV